MMVLTHCGGDVPVVKGKVSIVAQLLSVVSAFSTIGCCGRAESDFFKALHRDPKWSAVPFYLELDPSGEAYALTQFQCYGKKDMFSLLRTLLVRFFGMLVEPWVKSTHFLRTVGFIIIKFNNNVLMTVGLSGSCVFKALEDAGLDLHSAFLVVQEMLSHWAQIVSKLSATGQRQELQNVQRRVSLVILLLLNCFCGLIFTLMILHGQAFDVQVTGDDYFRM